MQKIILSGCNGRMGQVITELLRRDYDTSIAAGIDVNTEKKNGYPVYADIYECIGDADAVVDFTVAANTCHVLDYCVKRGLPVVIATTGQNEEQMEALRLAAKKIAVFKSANMSLGINLLADLIRRAVAVLGDGYDVEIIEKHHNQKLDAPSGTALMLADAAKEALPYEAEYCYERQSRREKRPKNEIGIHSVRGGTIVGEHEVMFAGHNEVITIAHSAQSREVFAVGTLRAARYIIGKEPGLYNMEDLIKSV